MFGLLDTRTGLRYERKTDIIESERQMARCRQSARAALVDGFARLFAAVGSGIEATFVGLGLATVVRKYRRWQIRQATIRDLSALDDRILSDIGLSRNSIPAMATKLVDAQSQAHGDQK